MLTEDPLALRWLALGFPALLTLAGILQQRPSRHHLTACFLASLWPLPVLVGLHLFSEELSWWSYQVEGGEVLGIPGDLLLGWMLLWGAVPTLWMPRLHPAALVGGMALLDLSVMPLFHPAIALGPRWLAGELMAMSLGLMPALALGRWTLERKNLAGRALLQSLLFGGCFFLVLPMLILGWNEQSALAALQWPPLALALFVQLLLLISASGLSATQEFVSVGRGTPLPWDPPPRLVESGLYRYLSNPMQLTTALTMLILGAMLRSPQLAGASLLAMIFSLGLARWQEQEDLEARLGKRGRSWRRAVPSWWPRWRPWVPVPAILYVDLDCGPCSRLARWLSARGLVGLTIRDAREHSEPLRRLRYAPMDGRPEEEGVWALGRALEHTHLGWALLGCWLRLPLLSSWAQLLADTTGFGPRDLEPRTDQSA